MLREEAKVGSLEMRANVRGDEWVKRLTAGRDIMKRKIFGNRINSKIQRR